jgi:preprotein translocase subunit SecD
MKSLLFLTLISNLLLAHSFNHFIIKNESVTLECKDVNYIKKISNYTADIDYTKEGANKMYQFTKNNVNKDLMLISNDKVIFKPIKITEPMGNKKLPKGEHSGMILHSETGNIDAFINTFKHCKNVIQYPKEKKVIQQKGTLNFNIGKEKLNFSCDDIKDIRGVAYKDFSFNLYFSKQGLEKVCKFTKNNINKNMDIFVDNNIVKKNITIDKSIGCDNDENNPYLIDSSFTTLDEIKMLLKSLCVDPYE